MQHVPRKMWSNLIYIICISLYGINEFFFLKKKKKKLLFHKLFYMRHFYEVRYLKKIHNSLFLQFILFWNRRCMLSNEFTLHVPRTVKFAIAVMRRLIKMQKTDAIMHFYASWRISFLYICKLNFLMVRITCTTNLIAFQWTHILQ